MREKGNRQMMGSVSKRDSSTWLCSNNVNRPVAQCARGGAAQAARSLLYSISNSLARLSSEGIVRTDSRTSGYSDPSAGACVGRSPITG